MPTSTHADGTPTVRPVTPMTCSPARACTDEASQASRQGLPGAHITSATLEDSSSKGPRPPIHHGPASTVLPPPTRMAQQPWALPASVQNEVTKEEGAELNTTPLHVGEQAELFI